jgi:hypothetical protein
MDCTNNNLPAGLPAAGMAGWYKTYNIKILILRSCNF